MMSILFRSPYRILYLLAMGFPLLSVAAPPVTPAGFEYKIYSDTAAELFWLRSTNVSVQGYELTRNGENLGLFDALSYYDDALTPRIEYTYTITAVGTDGERSGTSIVSLRTPQYEDTIASQQRTISSLEQEVEALESLLNNGNRLPIPQTGQTISIESGDDGDLQAGVPWPEPRFTVNVELADDLNGNGLCDGIETCNGTVTDNLTGLVWLQNANCYGDRTWFDAITEANFLKGDGSSICGVNDNSEFRDWRLPNVKEIQSLIDYGHAFPEALLPTDHPFVDVQIGGITSAPARYWTSTSTGSGNDATYTVSMSVGWVERFQISPNSNFRAYVWPVRSEQ